MNLSDYLETYYWYSGKASDVARQLSFAGIAAVWIFKTGTGTHVTIPEPLIISLAAFCAALAFDLLQYLVGSIIWGIFHRYHEVRSGEEETVDLRSPVWLKGPIVIFFWTKMFFVLGAYSYLIFFFWQVINR